MVFDTESESAVTACRMMMMSMMQKREEARHHLSQVVILPVHHHRHPPFQTNLGLPDTGVIVGEWYILGIPF